MGWKIVFTPKALESLEGIVRTISDDRPLVAVQIGDELVNLTEKLSDFPFLETSYPRLKNVRKLVLRPFLIFYRLYPESDRVEILLYWDGRREKPDLL